MAEGASGNNGGGAAGGQFALFGRNLFGEPVRADEAGAPASGPLAERFLFPPFTVLDARQGAWQERKRAWLALGIQSEIGRGEDLIYNQQQIDAWRDRADDRK